MPASVVLIALVALACYAGWRRSKRSSGVKFVTLAGRGTTQPQPRK
jgi:hypothetical protein